MRPLIIDDEARRKVAGLVQTARENPYTFERLQKVVRGEERPVGDHYRIILPMGYRVVYSLEQHPMINKQGFKWLHHLSVSVSRDNNTWPSQHAVAKIVEFFGMPPLEECFAYLEGEDDGTLASAVNILAVCADSPL